MTAAERKRLVGMLGRLGSNHDGERAAAGLLATRFLTALNLCWEDIIADAKAARTPAASTMTPPDLMRHQAASALRNFAALNKREVEFLRTVVSCRRALTPKQSAWPADIVNRQNGASQHAGATA